MADRIQARAIERCGELMRQIEASKDRGNQYRQRDGAVQQPTRTSVAAAAGLSERQRKTALRVANIPPSEFDMFGLEYAGCGHKSVVRVRFVLMKLAADKAHETDYFVNKFVIVIHKDSNTI